MKKILVEDNKLLILDAGFLMLDNERVNWAEGYLVK
jgi:hypothetical protein